MANDDFQGNYMETFSRGGEVIFQHCGRLISHKALSESLIEIACDKGTKLHLHILEDGLIRFRYSPSGYFEEDFSYAIDPEFTPKPADWKIIEFGDGIAIQTALLSVRISRDQLRARVTHLASGKTLSEDAPGFEWTDNRLHGGEVVRMIKKAHRGEHYYGLGDKSCVLDLREKTFSLWGSDTYGYGPSTDPLYKNIPFYVSVSRGLAHGIFFDNSFRTEFDFASTNHQHTSFTAPGGEMNYYLIYAKTPLEVCASYTRLTGTPEMPPLWALGFHQCKWSYYPEAEVRDIAKGFRERQIPCDSIYLDIDYMDGYRCFTWDAERFPDPKKMISDLEEDGFKVVAMIDPGLKIDPTYPIWKEGFENDYYCRRMDGPYFKGSVWPGLCHFPDFTRADVRNWWADLYQEFISDLGLRGIWNDMNEPAVFEDGTFTEDVRHSYEGNSCSHRKAHNVYGMQMVRATQEGLRRHGNGRRPFAITRSAYAGTQRFASAWTGDNVASWEHLRLANTQCQRMATSGYSFIGSDIGGFIETPTDELFARWVQLAVFHPFFRIHSSGDHNEQEPWSFSDDTTDLVRSAIEMRYRLLPAVYTAFWQYHKTGIPILRSLALMAYKEKGTYWRNAEFGFGDHMVVAPITQPVEEMKDHPDNQIGRVLYLPKGRWHSYWTDDSPESAGDVFAPCDHDHIPVYVRAGAVIPHWPLQQYVGENSNPTPNLHCWAPDKATTSQWYEDDGDGFGYQEGQFRASTLIVSKVLKKKTFTIERSWEGDWTPVYEEIDITLRALKSDQIKVTVDGEVIDTTSNDQGHAILSVAADFTEITVKYL